MYQCVGQPQPALMDQIFRLLLDSPIKESYESGWFCRGHRSAVQVVHDELLLELSKLTKEHGIALTDIIENLLDRVMEVDMGNEIAARLLDKIAAIQVRLASGTSEKIQVRCE